MRILQVIETGGPGGAETVFAQLSSGLRRRGHHVVCMTGVGDWLPDEMRRRDFEVVPWLGRGALSVSALRQVADVVRAQRIDVVHAHLFDGALYASLAARLTMTPCVVTLHGQVDFQRPGRATAVKRWLLPRLASRIAAVSPQLADAVRGLLPAAADRLSVIANGLEPTGATHRAAWGTRDATRPFEVVAIGNIRPAKDYATLMHAVSVLRDRGLSLRVRIAGQPDQEGLYEELLALRRTLALETTVTFLGFVPDPGALLAEADVFVLSSKAEGFSLAIVEAMLAGTPVVATASGGPESILRSGETGMLTPVGEPGALADALARLLAHPDEAQRLAQAARHDAMQRFTIEGAVDAYVDLYRSVTMR